MSVDGAIDDEWQRYVTAKRDAELTQIIDEERLRPDAAHAFIDQALREGALRTAGTAITTVLPPGSRFATNNGHGDQATRHQQAHRLLRPILRAQQRQLSTAAPHDEAAAAFSALNAAVRPRRRIVPSPLRALDVPVETHLRLLCAAVDAAKRLVQLVVHIHYWPGRDRCRIDRCQLLLEPHCDRFKDGIDKRGDGGDELLQLFRDRSRHRMRHRHRHHPAHRCILVQQRHHYRGGET